MTAQDLIMNRDEQIEWLETYCQDWDRMQEMDGDGAEYDALYAELVEHIALFCEANNLPRLSADELIIHIRKAV